MERLQVKELCNSKSLLCVYTCVFSDVYTYMHTFVTSERAKQ